MHTRPLRLMACLMGALALMLTACRGPDAGPVVNLSPEVRARTVPIVWPFKLVPIEEPLEGRQQDQKVAAFLEPSVISG